MSSQVVTTAIVLSRTNFGEADRILTVITPDYGKRRLMAKGVRKERSKLAGGIELFSISHITYIPGRRDIDTLISSRLITHYGNIVKDIPRTTLGYELLKRLNRATEEATGEEYFRLLERALKVLDESHLSVDLIDMWFSAQLLKLGGHQPNLVTDVNDKKLAAASRYVFDTEIMAFREREQGSFGSSHVKALRLVFSTGDPRRLAQVKGLEQVVPTTQKLISNILKSHIRT